MVRDASLKARCRGSGLARVERAVADIAAILHTVEVYATHRGVRGALRLSQGLAQRGDAENASTRSHDALTVRELRYQVLQRGCRTKQVTLVTTLLDADQYPAQELADLYGQRWQIETNLRHLKQTMKMDVLHCETEAGVLKELTMFALVYNLVRTVMHVASVRQEVPVDRISFADALG